MQHSQIFFNRCFDKNKLKGLITWSLKNYGEAATLELVEKLKTLGFYWATKAGISLSIDDLKIPFEKNSLLTSAEELSTSTVRQFSSGNLTTVERLQQLIDAWHRTSELLKQEVVQNFRRSDALNPVYMMAFSGARGNISQVRQLVGMRGLMADPQGRIIDFPIRSNFREGLTLTEYVISCYGARKGIVDTALRTATSGYLTRRLVDVAQHVVVSSYDCQTKEGILVTSLTQSSKVILALHERLIGRTLAEDIPGIALRNTCITQSLAYKISQRKSAVSLRSPLTCKARSGICQLCYGWSLAHGDLVSIGEAVGIIAAQSIGEPGTQLTMRTFHTGGVFSGEIIDQIEAPIDGVVEFPAPLKGLLVRTSYGKIGFLTREAGYLTIQSKSSLCSKQEIHFPTQTILFVREQQNVEKGQTIGEYASSATDQEQGVQATHLVTSPHQGEVIFEDLVVIRDLDGSNTQAYTLGSFWILSGQTSPTLLDSNGGFCLSKSDLLEKQASVSKINILAPAQQFLSINLLESSRNESELEASFPELNVQLLKVSCTKITYLKGFYLTKAALASRHRVTLAKNLLSIVSHFNRSIFSLEQLQLKSSVFPGRSVKKSASILFSLKRSWCMWQKFALVPTHFRYSQKLLSSIKLKAQSTQTSVTPEKSYSSKGSYCFKQVQTNSCLQQNRQRRFYRKPQEISKVAYSTFSSTWNFVCLNSSLIALTSLWQRFESRSQTSSAFGFSTRTETKRTGSTEGFLHKFDWFNFNFSLSKNFVYFALFNKEIDLTSFISSVTTDEEQLGNLLYLKKFSRLTAFDDTCSFLNFYFSNQIQNKQKPDQKLFLKPSLRFKQQPIVSKEKQLLTAITVCTKPRFNTLTWQVDSILAEHLSILGFSQVLLPTDDSKFVNQHQPTVLTSFDWSKTLNEYVNSFLVLGEINQRCNKSAEAFKSIRNSTSTNFLLIDQADLFGLELKPNMKSFKKPVLKALVRPGDEILDGFTCSTSGQLFSISKDRILVRKAFPFLISEKGNFHVYHRDFIKKGLPLITLSYNRLTTGDIVQGIPRIEQLFEARQTTTLLHAQLHELFETYKSRMRLDLAARKSFQKIQRILIDSIQKVYQTQGVTISDKHLEIIVRQMTSTVRIIEGGRTRLLRGELKPIDWIEKINAGIDIQKAEYEPILLGITKTSLETESFISAASFQETSRTLSRAAIEGRTDFLRGLKENVILGHRIPAGTGAPLISYLTKFSSQEDPALSITS
jgi:hypothetical protein